MESVKIITTDGKEFDTSKLPDLQAEMIEKIEGSGIREFAMKNNGCCFVYCGAPSIKGWATFHILDQEGLEKITTAFAGLVKQATDNKFKVRIVPNETEYS
jgi:hypothetical protein